MNWTLGAIALVILVTGLVGQAFEMRRIRIARHGGEMGSPGIFAHRSNFKWYAAIGTGVILWYAAERL